MIVLRLRTILAAAEGFLHGFLGLGALAQGSTMPASPESDRGEVACAHHAAPSPSPAAVRRALAIRAAGRRNCC